ncbi:nitroreductase/quinone reductase family protein [Promicromonospora sp. NPDC050880]|uniref:nitroreductase/quinone reductase family protein n=1 Tax=Promicromonospora sp. NPDC050880 TaxID=3364406 RepID=UPI00379578A5
MAGESTSEVRVPPRWFVRTAWGLHRRLYRLTGGRLGLRRPRAGSWGMLRLTTSGRSTCREHSVILAYVEDGPNIVTLAMNGWSDGDPEWWLNLQPHPDATADLVDGDRLVRARAAHGHERDRLWARWREVEPHLDAYAALRSTETALVVLEPRYEPTHRE